MSQRPSRSRIGPAAFLITLLGVLAFFWWLLILHHGT